MTEPLDEERLEILRRWGTGLGGDEREELRAAGKAIVMLVDEIERLHVDRWHARAAASVEDEDSRAAPAADGAVEAVSSQELATSLRDRIRDAISPRATRNAQE
jgi:hypothetical protein